MEKINESILDEFKINEINVENDTRITNVRHKQLICDSIEQLNKAVETMEMNMPIDIIAVHIKGIMECLGEITGDTYTDELIDELFSRFCLGK